MKTLQKIIAVALIFGVTNGIKAQDVLNNPVSNIKNTPDYVANLDLFYFLSVGIFLQLIAILIMANSIVLLVKSDYFQNKIADKKSNNHFTNIIVALISFGLITYCGQSYALAFSYPGENTGPTPWLLVENSDIYFMVVINIILLLVIFYLKSMFKNFLRMIRSEKDSTAKIKSAKKINRFLTDVVPIEEESRIMLHHEYDGIRELDNNLPPWWVWGFFATIIFSVVYLFNYHVFKTSDLQISEYEKEITRSDRKVKAYLAKMAMNVDETNAVLMTDSKDLSAGKSIYQTNCVTCHNPKGEGNIGPNLTDKFWIYSYDIKEVFKTIKLGTPNGMPEHNSKLNPIQIQQVSSYILQLPEVKGKDAEGTIIEK